MSKKKKKKPQAETPETASRYILAVPFFAVILLMLLGALLPGRWTWGISFLSLFGSEVAILTVILALLVTVPPIAASLTRLLSPPMAWLTRLIAGINRQVLVIIISVAATFILFYWRSRSFVYGDGYILLTDAASGDKLVLASGHYLKILTVFLNHYAYDLLSSFTGWSADKVVGLLNATGGMLGLWAVYRICRQSSSDTATRAFIFLGSLSSASVVLFFGYIENYTWALSFALWTLSFSIGYSRKQNGAGILLITAAVAVLFHLINLALLAIALMAIIIKVRPDGSYVMGIRLKYLNLGIIVGSFIAVGLSRLANITFFVPLLPVDENPYSLFASGHVVDILNQIALAAPLGVAILLLTLIYMRERQTSASAEKSLLGTAVLLLFLAAIWIDPELGAPRDWDLLSFYGIPLTVWGLDRFISYSNDGRVARHWLVAAGILAGITLIPHLYEKNHPDLAVARLDALLYVDPHYQVTYDKASRCEPWAVALQKGYGDMRLAMKYLERRISVSPDSHIAHFNLADSYYYLGILDSAYMCMCRGLALKANEAQKMVNASAIARELGNNSDAVMWAQKALQLEPSNVSALTQLGVSLTFARRPVEALPYFRKAYDIAPLKYDHIVNMGMVHALTGTPDSAYRYYVEALPLSPDDRKIDVYFCLVSLGIDLGRFGEARRYLEEMRRIDPTSPDIPQLEAKLAEALKR